MSVNRGKKSVTLDLKAEAGKTVLRKLLAGADVLVENFRPGTLARLGFGWEAVHALNPRLVYCSISGFGESGPEASRPDRDDPWWRYHVVQGRRVDAWFDELHRSIAVEP